MNNKSQIRAAMRAADRQIAGARRDLLVLRAQGVDLSQARAILASQGIDLDRLLAADTRAKRLALTAAVKAGLPSDPLAAQAKLFEGLMTSFAGALLCDADLARLHPAPGEPPPFSQN